MGGGVWYDGVKKERAGNYMRWKAAALASIGGGTRGVLAIPVRSNWGPVKKITTVTMANLVDLFGNVQGEGFTAYRMAWLALLGKPSQLLLYRLADGTEEAKTYRVMDNAASGAEVATLETIYPTTRDFKVTIRESAADSTQMELILYEGTAKLFSCTAPKGVGVSRALVDAVNKANGNKYIKATYKSEGDGTLKTVSSALFTGGNDGVTSITSLNYVDAMTAFEATNFNGFVLDTAGDSALRLTVKVWAQRLRDAGKGIRVYMGGTNEEDLVPATGNARSISMNHEGIVNVIVSGMIGEEKYPSYQVAAWVAGHEEGLPLQGSSTFALTPFENVEPRLTDIEITEGLRSGSFMLVAGPQGVLVEKGINTLTSLSGDQNNSFKKLKIIRFRDSVNDDISTTARKQWIGKIPNSPEGRDSVLGGIKAYFQTLVPSLLVSYEVYADDMRNAQAEGDEFYWGYRAVEVDNMERIYGEGRV